MSQAIWWQITEPELER